MSPLAIAIDEPWTDDNGIPIRQWETSLESRLIYYGPRHVSDTIPRISRADMSDKWLDFNVTSLVQRQINEGATTLLLFLNHLTGEDVLDDLWFSGYEVDFVVESLEHTNYLRFYTSDYNNGEFAPQLIINYDVPGGSSTPKRRSRLFMVLGPDGSKHMIQGRTYEDAKETLMRSLR